MTFATVFPASISLLYERRSFVRTALCSIGNVPRKKMMVERAPASTGMENDMGKLASHGRASGRYRWPSGVWSDRPGHRLRQRSLQPAAEPNKHGSEATAQGRVGVG